MRLIAAGNTHSALNLDLACTSRRYRMSKGGRFSQLCQKRIAWETGTRPREWGRHGEREAQCRLRQEDRDRNRVSVDRVAQCVAVDDIDAIPAQLRCKQRRQQVFARLRVADVGRREEKPSA